MDFSFINITEIFAKRITSTKKKHFELMQKLRLKRSFLIVCDLQSRRKIFIVLVIFPMTDHEEFLLIMFSVLGKKKKSIKYRNLWWYSNINQISLWHYCGVWRVAIGLQISQLHNWWSRRDPPVRQRWLNDRVHP